jgi:hypothetical protein
MPANDRWDLTRAFKRLRTVVYVENRKKDVNKWHWKNSESQG